MRAVAYARVSTDGQAENGYGLPEQRSKLEEYCQRRGYNLVEMVCDEGISGRLQDRPGLRRLHALADAGAVDCVVIAKIDRLGRSNRVVQQALYDLHNRGVEIEFTEHASGNTASDRLLLNTLGGISEFEMENIRERTMNGRTRKAETTGRHPTGRAPYGFTVVSKAQAAVLPEYAGRDGEYLVHEEQARWVREIFAKYSEGGSTWHIQTWLNDAGVPAPAGGQWNRNSVTNTLRNPAYAGRPVFHRQDIRKHETPAGVKTTRRLHPQKDWIEMKCPALVSEEVFAAVQARLDDNRDNGRGRHTDRWALKGCVVCGVCVKERGDTPRRCFGREDLRNKRTPRLYVCTSRTQRGVPFCGCQYDADALQELARLALETAATPGVLAEAARHRAMEAARTAGDPGARVKECQKGLAALDTEEEQIADLALKGFSSSLVSKRLEALNKKRETLQKALGEAQDTMRQVEAPEAAASRGEALAQRLQEALDDPEKLADLTRSVLRITLKPNEPPEIEVRVPPTA